MTMRVLQLDDRVSTLVVVLLDCALFALHHQFFVLNKI